MARDSSWFDYFILICILLNTVIMAINWYGCPPDLLNALEYTNYFFTVAFTIESLIKLIAYGVRGYFQTGWNIFDFLIVLISYITLIIGFATARDIGPKQATIARAFRIGRIFRLITKARFLRVIFNTIIFTIPSLANVGALMMLLLFIFAILGVQIFATVKLQDTLNDHANFQNFGIALLTLIRLQTGEGWNEVMKDLARKQDVYFDCDDTPDYESIQANGGHPNGCGTSFSYMFFVLFQLIVSIIFLNLFVAVILNGFTNSNEEEGFEVFKNNLASFKQIWKRYDPEASGFIKIESMSDLVQDLEKETEFITTSLSDPKLVRNFIAHLQVPVYNSFSKYYYQDILTVLSRKYIGHKYVLEFLKNMEIQDDVSKVQAEKSYREVMFEEEIDDIQNKAMEEKIQLIEENMKHANKYKTRMYVLVDRFIDEVEEEIDGQIVKKPEEKIYDSSYIIWVPYIQMRLKPWLKRFKDRKRQAELDRMEVDAELANITSHRQGGGATQRGGPTTIGGDLIIETGSQLVSNLAPRATHRQRLENGAPLGENGGRGGSNGAAAAIDGQFGNTTHHNFPSAQSMNEEEINNIGKNMKGQTTGEVGGTLFMLGDENPLENSRVEYSRILNTNGGGASPPITQHQSRL